MFLLFSFVFASVGFPLLLELCFLFARLPVTREKRSSSGNTFPLRTAASSPSILFLFGVQFEGLIISKGLNGGESRSKFLRETSFFLSTVFFSLFSDRSRLHVHFFPSSFFFFFSFFFATNRSLHSHSISIRLTKELAISYATRFYD